MVTSQGTGCQRPHNNGTAFLTALSRAFPQEDFPPPHGCQPIVERPCSITLNVERQARKQHAPFLKSLVRLSQGLNHPPPRLGADALTITPLCLVKTVKLHQQSIKTVKQVRSSALEDSISEQRTKGMPNQNIIVSNSAGRQ